MTEAIVQAIRQVGDFCGPRDVAALTPAALEAAIGQPQVDVMVLFGGSILAGGDAMARAIRQKVARRFVLVGGAGHTTETLRRRVMAEYPAIRAEGLSEADIFQRYLQTVHGVQADWLETRSTNCGNNITYLLELLAAHQVEPHSILLCQDATMQRRMEAGLRLQGPAGLRIVNYAAYHAEVALQGDQVVLVDPPHGMWTLERYLQLLMGEIPRLRDDADGYGPRGKGFIAHLDIPPAVGQAFALLQQVYGTQVRPADPRFASRP